MMRFVGENALRMTKETVMSTLEGALNGSLIGTRPKATAIIFHRNGDVSLKFRPATDVTAVLKREAELAGGGKR
jgi:hypothetical protein